MRAWARTYAQSADHNESQEMPCDAESQEANARPSISIRSATLGILQQISRCQHSRHSVLTEIELLHAAAEWIGEKILVAIFAEIEAKLLRGTVG